MSECIQKPANSVSNGLARSGQDCVKRLAINILRQPCVVVSLPCTQAQAIFWELTTPITTPMDDISAVHSASMPPPPPPQTNSTSSRKRRLDQDGETSSVTSAKRAKLREIWGEDCWFCRRKNSAQVAHVIGKRNVRVSDELSSSWHKSIALKLQLALAVGRRRSVKAGCSARMWIGINQTDVIIH